MRKTALIGEILKNIYRSNKPVSAAKLKKLKTFKKVSLRKFASAVDGLLKDSIVRKTKEGLVFNDKNKKIKHAVVTRVCNTFGFVKDAETGEEFLIPGRFMMGMLPGDEVLIKQFLGMDQTQLEGKVLSITSSGPLVYRGRITKIDEVYVFSSREIKFPLRVKTTNEDVLGKLVSIKIKKRGQDVDGHIATVSEIIGQETDPGSCCKLILDQNNISLSFSDKVLSQARKVAGLEISEKEYQKRLDLRDEIIFTIDGEDSKDLDDAVSVSRLEGGGYRLGVHIADVSYYVKRGSALDEEAFKRGTSIYFADKVIPMLPKELSNGICSLNPNEDRLTFSAIIDIDSEGKMTKYEFKKSIIRSRVKGVYSEINAILEGKETKEIKNKYKDVKDHILLMVELADLFHGKRRERGCLDLETQECKIKIDGEKIEILPLIRGKSEQIIEEFMLKANEAAAMFARKNEIPFIYRVHESPPGEKLSALCNILSNLGIVIPKNNSQSELSKVIDSVRDTNYHFIVNNIILRSMAKAKYSEEYKPHYGLVLADYSHFTSPIRRYPDLMIHRIMSKCLEDNGERKKYFAGEVGKVAFQSSEREKTADSVERECEDIYKAAYMSSFIGQEFEGIVSSVQQYGFFVQLPSCIEGLVHKSTLPDGEYEMVNMIEMRDFKNNMFNVKLGDTVKVKLIKVDVFSGQIDFEMVL